MSYAQLMRHAADIRDRAASEAIREQKLPPFDRHGNPRTAEESRDALAASRATVLAQGLADIPDLFQPFAEMPDPALFDGPRGRAHEAAGALATGESGADPLDTFQYVVSLAFSEVRDASAVLQRWHGPAATAFRNTVLTPFPERLTNQFRIALLLRGALDAERAIWEKARADVDAIAHGTLNALDALDDCTKFEWTMTFTVVASVAALAALPTAGSSLGAAITLVGASSQVSAAADREDAPKTEYSGRTVDAVLDNMRDAITRLTEAIHTQETKIATALSTALASVRETRSGFLAPRPALVDATRASIREDLGDVF